MKIYLAIPYTGNEEESFRRANKYAGELMQQGHIVFSPISHTHPIACECELPKEWEFWERFDTCFIEWCDEIYVCCCDGWTYSKGVQAEIRIASRLHKPVSYLKICPSCGSSLIVSHGAEWYCWYCHHVWSK